MNIPTKRLDALDPTINPQRDHEFAAMRDGISNKLRVEQILALLQSSDIPAEAVTLAKLAADARAAQNHTFNDTAAQLGETDVQGAIDALAAKSSLLSVEQITDDEDTTPGLISGERMAQFVAETPSLFSQYYKSTEQTMTNGGLITLAHGFGVRPDSVQVSIVCVTDDRFFVVGQEYLPYDGTPGGTSNDKYGISIYWDDTNIYAQVSAQGLAAISPTTVQTLTTSRWRLIARAWA